MKSDGTFEIQESFDKLNGPKRSGSWKVVNAEDGKFKLHIVWDTTPDRTAGWVIEQKDDEHLTIVDGAPGFGKKFRRVK